MSLRLLRMQFRFTDPDDVATYGDGWHLWDEPAVAGLRGRELIALEDQLDAGLSVIKVLRGLRDEDTLATMAAMWIALHREGHPAAWAGFDPVVNAADWEVTPPVPLDPGPEPAPDSGSSSEPSTESGPS